MKRRVRPSYGMSINVRQRPLVIAILAFLLAFGLSDIRAERRRVLTG